MLKICRLGSPILRKKAQKLKLADIKSRNTKKLIELMIASMRSHEGVGIAAPQVGVSKRIFCVECVSNRRYTKTPQISLYTVINPELDILDKREIHLYEGCLSIPDLRGVVPRARKVRLRGLNPKGEAIQIVASGFHARILQHEFDHLEGRVYLDRVVNSRSLKFVEFL